MRAVDERRVVERRPRGQDDDSSGLYYWRARRMVAQLLVVEVVGIDDFLGKDHDEAAVLERVRARAASR